MLQFQLLRKQPNIFSEHVWELAQSSKISSHKGKAGAQLSRQGVARKENKFPEDHKRRKKNESGGGGSVFGRADVLWSMELPEGESHMPGPDLQQQVIGAGKEPGLLSDIVQ